MPIFEEACLTTLYTLNKNPHGILKDETIKEAFVGEKPCLK